MFRRFGAMPFILALLAGGWWFYGGKLPSIGSLGGGGSKAVLYKQGDNSPPAAETALCSRCDSMLIITSTNWSESIRCPKCGRSTTVEQAIGSMKRVMSPWEESPGGRSNRGQWHQR